jgi:putative FmdB family regulatory protein
MPIYEFACSDCGIKFEKRVSFSATAAPPCDNCQSENVERLLSAPAIHFKGSGWYINDSKKADKGSANGTTTSETKSETSDSTASSDSGSESKSSGDSSSESSTKSETKSETISTTTKESS